MSATQPENVGRRAGNWGGLLGGIFWGGVAGGLLVFLWSVVCTVPALPWNAARLAPSFALARGLPIYALRDEGAHLGWFYGPGFPLWNLPLGFMENPTWALMAFGVWNAATWLGPLYLVVRVVLGGQPGVAGRATLCGAVLLLADRVTAGVFYFVHVDAVCVAGVLLAAVALHAAAVRAWKPGLPLAALAVALAIATKQLAVVFLPATLVWLWREGHGRLIRAWLFWLAVVGGGLAVVVLAGFGAEQLLFNAWWVPGRTPMRGGWALLGTQVMEVVVSGWLWWLAAGLGWWWARRTARERDLLPPEAGSFVRLLLWAALWQAPLGLLASLKEGGGLNSVHAIPYVLVAGVVVIGAAIAAHDRSDDATRSAWPARGFAAMVVAGLVAAGRTDVVRHAEWTPYRGLDGWLEQAKSSPGKIYFPWNPLITIISDRKVYPFDDAVKCLWIAKLEPPVAAIRAAMPKGAVIYYQEPSQSKFMLNYVETEARKDAFPKR